MCVETLVYSVFVLFTVERQRDCAALSLSLAVYLAADAAAL